MNTKNLPFNLDVKFIRKANESLSQVDFTESAVVRHLNGEESISVTSKEIPRLLRMTSEKTPLDIFIRLFILGVDVEVKDARCAVGPMSLDAWCKSGLLQVKGKSVSAPLRLVPVDGLLVSFDFSPQQSHQKIQSDHVHGIGKMSINLLNATIRRDREMALDLGTGCGIQGMMLARHSQHVISTDVNPRALNIAAFNSAINGLNNIEFREGNCFEPVRNEQFDIITMNPPFAISPEQRFFFRDSGMDADGFIQKLIKDAPNYLKEGGFLQLTAQWAHIKDSDWQNRLSQWFKNTGCDAWVIRLMNQSIETYATNWITETEKVEPVDYERKWHEWIKYYERLGIESVGTGIINMHKINSSPNLFWVHEDAVQIDEFAGAAIYNGFKVKEFLEQTPDKDLLHIPFHISPDTRIEQKSRSQGDGWIAEKVIIRMTKGIHYAGNVDIHLLELLGQCNGKRPLQELIIQLAKRLGITGEQIAASVLQIMRGLIERGFVLPTSLSL